MDKDKTRHQKAHIILGQNIRQIRESKKLSQEELGFQIKSARNYIGCIERGEKSPSLDIIFDIAKALNCKVGILFKEI
ncbi:MAG: helix-turn-helix transcriptional regulator [Candidatus Gastranaerophilales bacterium]|nr:helix-turn-helix transcriptional regulator [Candidatus Gastranaerophilales bacterium]